MPTDLQTKPNPQHSPHPIQGWNLSGLWDRQAGLTWSGWPGSCCERWSYVGCWDHELKPAKEGEHILRRKYTPLLTQHNMKSWNVF